MSWRDAPVYVEAHDLALWVLERANSWPRESDRHVGALVAADAAELVCAISLSLTFPMTRRQHLQAADEAIVRLRILLRLARDLSLLSAGGLRFAAGRLQVIGRMVGGWQKRLRKTARPRDLAAL